MFELQDVVRQRGRRSTHLEDLQYELCLSYIRHASEKLALRESELMLQSTLFLNSLSQHDKSLTDPSTTDASFENRRSGAEEMLSPRAAERRAFMRKSKRGYERPTMRGLQQALQQVKEVCSEGTIVIVQAFMGEYRKIVEELTRSDFREAFTRKKCENCIARSPEPLPQAQDIADLEERLKKVSGELRNTVAKNEELAKQLAQKICELEKAQALQLPQNTLNSFLTEKENLVITRLREVKLVERDILMRLEGICQSGGCQRCRCIRAVKAQLVDFRTYLERQAQNLQKLYQRLKKSYQAGH